MALAAGLFFLIRAAVKKGNHEGNLRAYVAPDVGPTPTYTGINPIYVSPIPYSNMELATVSGFVASPGG